MEGSYPTWRGMETKSKERKRKQIKSSYPTYEEWKQEGIKTQELLLSQFLSYPMRNGNKNELITSESLLLVLILPMRNGNKK